MISYRRLQQYALVISVISVLYNGLEGGLSIGLGVESASRSLIFFGIQSAVEVASACIVLWRFKNVAKPGEERNVGLDGKHLRFERRCTFLIGILLVLLALSTVATSIAILVLHQGPDSSNASLIISSSALILMILIWLPKRYLARALDSSTMQGEATCSLSCIQMTIVLFIGALVHKVWPPGWWLDGAAAIGLGFLFAWEGIKMVRWARNEDFNGGCCSDCSKDVVRRRGDIVLEEGELEGKYRDICSCCEEKEACRTSDSCQCESTTSGDACCKKTDPSSDDSVCCTRELRSKKTKTASTQAEPSAPDLSDVVSECSCCEHPEPEVGPSASCDVPVTAK